MFDKILIANRGEIACRIIRTARRLGISSVAVYSEADRNALHVAEADEAYAIGPPPARESYLQIDRIIAAAQRSGAAAIHPGYGFLSENADFAEACEAAGLVFIGPPASAIRAMGSKAAAKALMAKAGVPTVPGYHGAEQGTRRLAAEAERIGYPVLIKASAGGGGKGMRIVDDPADLAAALAAARREAKSSFGDDRVLIEKYLTAPRHIEVQVFADRHGNCVHLFERDCSIQRRHQKVVEEAPAPGLDEGMRCAMGEAAIAACRAVDYVGAGTVEFIVEGGAFHFMEMNTRLQVEHAVTEMITGTDLVEWQFRVAAGEALPLRQQDLAIAGHAVEARLYAEDPERDFLPAAGVLQHWRTPSADTHLRVETGVREGDRIGIDYDPLLAKLVVWGEDRAAALRRLSLALAGTEIAGLANNLGFLARLAAEPDFAAGRIDTGFIAAHRARLVSPLPLAPRHLAAAALAVVLDRAAAIRDVASRSADPYSPWYRADGWRLNGTSYRDLAFRTSGQAVTVRVHDFGNRYRLEVGADSLFATAARDGADGLRLTLDGVVTRLAVLCAGNEVTVLDGGATHRLLLADPLAAASSESRGSGRLTAPMPGKIVAVLAKPRARVQRGAALVVIEAMKMEHTVTAPEDGIVERVDYAPGDLVEEGTELVVLVPTEAADETGGEGLDAVAAER